MLREEDIIISLYCAISDVIGEKDFKHAQGSLWLSEIVLIGVSAPLLMPESSCVTVPPSSMRYINTRSIFG